MKLPKIIIVSALSLALSLILAACTKSGAPSEAKPVTLTVDMSEFKFDPNTMEVPAGAEVTLNLKNSGTLEHEYVIVKLNESPTSPFDDDDEAKVLWEAELNAGQAGEFTFTAPDTPGEYDLVCGVPGHMEAGMTGKLVVTQP